MKTKIFFYVFSLVFVLVFPLSFALQGTSSDGSITAKNGGFSAAGALGSGADITGRVAGSAGIASSYTSSDGAITGSAGPDMSTVDTVVVVKREAIVEEEERHSNLGAAAGGSGGSGAEGGAEGHAATTEAFTEQQQAETYAEHAYAEQATETSVQPVVEATAAVTEPVTIAIELSEGSALTLSPDGGAAAMSVLTVTESTATIVIKSAQTAASNAITGAVVIGVEQQTTMEVGEVVEVDSDGDGSIDLEIKLEKIVYDTEAGEYRALFTTTYLRPTEETVSFLEEQVKTGEVTFVEKPEKLFFEYWLWAAIAIFIAAVLLIIFWVLRDKRKRINVPTTIPTHYFEKILRKELQPSRDIEKRKKQQKKELEAIISESNAKKKRRTTTKKKRKKLKKQKKKRRKIKKKGKKRKNNVQKVIPSEI